MRLEHNASRYISFIHNNLSHVSRGIFRKIVEHMLNPGIGVLFFNFAVHGLYHIAHVRGCYRFAYMIIYDITYCHIIVILGHILVTYQTFLAHTDESA